MHQGKFDKKEIRFLEIYNEDCLIDTLNLDTFHEKILDKSQFGKPFVWNK